MDQRWALPQIFQLVATVATHGSLYLNQVVTSIYTADMIVFRNSQSPLQTVIALNVLTVDATLLQQLQPQHPILAPTVIVAFTQLT